jgi:hypothetical protein
MNVKNCKLMLNLLGLEIKLISDKSIKLTINLKLEEMS